MRSVNLVIIFLLIFLSCNDSGNTNPRNLPKSLGNINTLQVIITNDLWNGEVGEEIRTHFAAPVDGLPQEEPLFSMNQMPPSTYTDFARKYRTVLHVTIDDKEEVILSKDPFAKPQTGAFITAKSSEDLVRVISENQQRIIAAFKASEIREKQKRIRISLKNLDTLKLNFGVNLNLPTAYRTALSSKEFYWLRKDLKSGTTNVIVYEVPFTAIADSNVVGSIIKIRDLIGGSYLPVEDDSVFITEEAYAPYVFTTEIDGHFAYETKGIWEVKDKYMAGPFVNYAIKDSVNNRYLILEGFTYAPSVEKRDLQFELEAILKSAKFQ